jgi:hypothetical protein
MGGRRLSRQQRTARIGGLKRRQTAMLCARLDHWVAIAEAVPPKPPGRKEALRRAEIARQKLQQVDH